MATITSGADSTTPDGIIGWASRRPSRNVDHDVIDKPAGDVTLRAPGPRRGTLRLLYLASTDAYAAEALHARAGTFTLTPDPDEPIPAMTYAVDATGDVALSSTDDGGTAWTLDVAYRELP
jgi:hypothetical protein